MQRVEKTNSEKYLAIGYERNNEDYNQKPLNSEIHLIKSENTLNFLNKKGVL